MTITINESCTLITVSSTILDDFIAAPASYTDIKIKGTLLTNDGITKTYTDASPITAITDVATSGGVETILPTFFGDTNTVFSNGVFKFEITLTGGSSVATDDGCIFVDCAADSACTGAMLESIYNLDIDDPDRALMLLDYNLLIRINDCQCKCDKAIAIYEHLNTKLGNTCISC